MMSQQITKYSIVMANTVVHLLFVYLTIYLATVLFRHPGNFAVNMNKEGIQCTAKRKANVEEKSD